jgi:hypothetical protein
MKTSPDPMSWTRWQMRLETERLREEKLAYLRLRRRQNESKHRTQAKQNA